MSARETTKPSKWGLKEWLTLAAFFGVTSVGTLLSQTQQIIGWGAGPSIEQAQDRGLDSLRAWLKADRDAALLWQRYIETRIDSIVDRQKFTVRVLRKMPQAKDAVKKIKREDRDRDDFFGRRNVPGELAKASKRGI